LQNDGVKSLDYLGAGDNAVIASFAKARLLRFRGREIAEQPNTGDFVRCPYVTMPFYQKEVSGCRVLGVYEHYSLNRAIREARVTRQQAVDLVYMLRADAAKNGCYIADYMSKLRQKFEQFALLDDFTPIVIDIGAIVAADRYFEVLSGLAKKSQEAKTELQLQRKEFEDLKSARDLKVPEGIRWDGKWHTESGEQKVLAYYPDSKKFAETGVNADLGAITKQANSRRWF
jgi:hypothetical protein